MNYALSYPVKRCSKCERTLPRTLVYFPARKSVSDGLNRRCRECVNFVSRMWYNRNHEEILENKRKYREANKSHIREWNRKYYENNREYLDAYKREYAIENREYVAEYNRLYRLRNKEEIAIQRREYYLEHREEILEQRYEYYLENKDYINARKKEYMRTDAGKRIDARKRRRRKFLEMGLVDDLTESEWAECLEIFDNSCAYCGDSIGSLHKEHFIPVGDGGGTTSSNIVPSCASCNSSKFTKDFFEWYPNYKEYSEDRMAKVVSYISTRMRGEDV